MRLPIHNMVKVLAAESAGDYFIYWADDDGQNMAKITYCIGYENAIRVANGIAHGQVEFVQHPPPPHRE